jgi:predicted RNA-binding protein with PIN domain
MPILIDGYNLLRAVQKIQEYPDFSDVDLCVALCEYLRRTDDLGQMVFDGIGPPNKQGLVGLQRLEVIFSGKNVEADAVIERLIHEYSAPKRMIVVSSDRRIRTAAKRRKCPDVPAMEFWMVVCQTLERPLPIAEPKAKRLGIGEKETDRWMKTFGLEQ